MEIERMEEEPEHAHYEQSGYSVMAMGFCVGTLCRRCPYRDGDGLHPTTRYTRHWRVVLNGGLCDGSSRTIPGTQCSGGSHNGGQHAVLTDDHVMVRDRLHAGLFFCQRRAKRHVST